MNRRQFVRATSLIAATGATYMVSPIARAGGYQENLLSTPDLCIGRQFLLDNGTLLTFSLPGLAFFVWTAANLVPRALAHHRDYRARFTHYPAQRRALIPFLL